jgi:hypothetical protein
MHDLQRMATSYSIAMAMMVRNLPWRRIAIVSAVSAGAIVIAYSVSFFWPRTVQFSYSSSMCITNPVLLPGLVTPQASQGYSASLPASISIGNVPLYSHQTCLSPREAPQGNSSETVYLAPLGIGFAKKPITIQTPELPKASAMIDLKSPVSIKDPFVFQLDQADELFTYQLSGNKKTVACTKEVSNTVSCDLTQLSLVQSMKYKLTLERLFNNQQPETVQSITITTVEPISIVSSSIAANATVYDKPGDLKLTFNKAIASYDGVSLKHDNKDLPITHKLTNDKTLLVTFKEPLPRSANLQLTIKEVFAKDRGYLSKAYSLPFITSGGPKVLGISIGRTLVSPDASITVTFDSTLAGGQNLLHFIRAERDAGQMDASYTHNGNRVTIYPRGGMPRCTDFRIRVLDGLTNEAGISGGSGTWVYSSRTICQSTFSIGSSVNGRGILAYRFGSGSEKIVFVGSLHGNEPSSAYILHSLIDYLESNPGAVPAHRTVVIIPIASPDGYAIRSRMNMHSVDLNRNFPTSNWQSSVTQPNGDYYEHGGGTEPLSEPESAALASYISGQNPRLVMSYHAAAKIVSANEVGNSYALAQTYGQMTGYPAYGNDTGGTFGYAITGAFEDWLKERGTPCILIELITKSGNEFSRHREAMIKMIQS